MIVRVAVLDHGLQLRVFRHVYWKILGRTKVLL